MSTETAKGVKQHSMKLFQLRSYYALRPVKLSIA